jgi:hypothetical protein
MGSTAKGNIRAFFSRAEKPSEDMKRRLFLINMKGLMVCVAVLCLHGTVQQPCTHAFFLLKVTMCKIIEIISRHERSYRPLHSFSILILSFSSTCLLRISSVRSSFICSCSLILEVREECAAFPVGFNGSINRSMASSPCS